jgi:hypothetical protein
MIYEGIWFNEIHADKFLTLMLKGLKRAGERHRDKLNTVDEEGNLITPDAPKLDKS